MTVRRDKRNKSLSPTKRRATATYLLGKIAARVLGQSSQEAMALLTLDGVILEVNPRWEKLLDLPRETIVGRHILDFHPPASAARVAADFLDVQTGRLTQIEIRGARGQLLTIELTGSIVTEQGTSYFLSIGRDVTDRVRGEETRLRAHIQRSQQQKMEALEQLATGIAHDFNNMLAVILTNGSLLLEDLKESHPYWPLAHEMVEAAQRGRAVIRQLLAFTRRSVAAPELLLVNEVVGNAQGMLRMILGPDIKLEFSPAPQQLMVLAERGPLEEVLANLASNARDAMPDGGRLMLRTRAVEVAASEPVGIDPLPASRYMMIEAQDTGMGMDEATRLRVFEPFFSAKGGKNAGLGLSTVYGIVKRSGGTVSVTSAPGAGALFRIYLPVASTSPALPEPEAQEAPARGSAAHTILVVDDEDLVRSVVCRVLRSRGYTVIEASRASQALEILRARPHAIDLVLTDVLMPEMSGPELAGALRALAPDMPVMFMSGHADDADLAAVTRDPESFLAKPFSPVALTERVEQALRRRVRK